ncbi:Leucine-rich repeat-containing N-terminal, type 2 [Cynara cardunculus var. scolymus]|uniref:non-specific serine/threonine protein kinase n=1 Tax=Cynara cardunculus var. scolymus TaxID=59895 RepID=A0A103XMF1_CYNCS|nr:Leucine-rich repeat-containing N-terminal, type 2 [Cynara cardunculus var. scolymus]
MSPESISGQYPFFLLLIFLIIIAPSSSQSDPRQILLKISTDLGDSSLPVFSTWNENNPVCNFTGIVCNGQNSVKEINLSQQQLAGTIDFDSICSLGSLEKISLGSNLLHGTISSHLSKCTHLQYLDLGYNLFSGEFPEISSLTHLQFLNLNLSGFSGPFPWQSLQSLNNLTYLSLGDNPFEMNPFPLEILKLGKLQTLYLTNSTIQGTIPEEIGNLRLLQSLELSGNYLVGTIPKAITKLTNLQELELYDNELTGTFPVGFGNLVMLAKLDVSNNSLEGDLSELRNLTRLESLQLFENKFSGEIPVEFGEFKFLKQFSIYDNKFTGELPAKIGSWADFEYIDVSENFLTGSIPPDMCKNGKMFDILMLQNTFTGGLPETYANCSSLSRLRVNNNSLSGRVPDGIWSLPSMKLIDLTMNQFEGQVTPNIGEAKSLQQLFIANNRFSGELPEEISEVSSLVEMELMSNQFTGQIPARIGDLKKLNSLHLEGNFFSGAIPESLGSCVSLSDLNLAGNSFSGQIPASLGSLPSLNSLNLSGNKLSGVIPASLSSLKLSLIDFSNNMLIGRVPESLLAEAYNNSFAGNPGLCAEGRRDLRRCSPISHKSSDLNVAKYCFIAGALVLVLSLACFLFVKSRRKDRKNLTDRGFSWDMKQFHVISINEGEILRSLKQENLIGQGGSGNVYKVELGCGKKLAVKHMWKSGIDSGDRKSYPSGETILPKRKIRWPEYDAEVATLSSIRHVNVVKLYCSITSEDSNLLVYEYMPNGSLWDRLHTYQKVEMNWDVRYEIAIGAAKGLEYLHHGCDRPVIHRDVKSSNILLDEEMKPKIADFGLAKIVQTNKVMDSTHIIAGTHGYIAPGKSLIFISR